MTSGVDQLLPLLPTWFRSRDADLVAGLTLLTTAEQAELNPPGNTVS